MTALVVGVLVVVGSCIALWWHHQRFHRLLVESKSDEANSEEARLFAQQQYNRRSITTTMIGVVGLTILATEISDSKWLDLVVMCLMTILLLVIPVMALLDFQATHRYFRSHDGGVKQATRNLAAELRKVEAQLREQKENAPSESESPLSAEEGAAKRAGETPANPETQDR